MRRPVAMLSLALLLLVPSHASACSQCQCGMPFPPDALGGPAPSHLRFALEEQFLSKQNGIEGAPGVEKEREHHVSALAVLRASNSTILRVRVPFVFKSIRTEPVGGPSSTETSRGLGDVELSALVKVHEFTLAADRAMLLSAVAAVRAPSGANELKDETGVRRDEHLQSGTGAWSGLVAADLSLPLSSGRLALNVGWRGNGQNTHGYRYGDVVLYNLGFARRLGTNLEGSLQANGRVAKQDRLEDGSLGENTGGHVLYLSPGVRLFLGTWLIEGGMQFPVSSDLKGEQQEHATARVAVSLAR